MYSAGYGRFQKPLFFLGRLLRVEERAGFTILVSSCEYARELAAPPAMLQGRTIFLRQESARRYLWEKIEEWQWRKQDNAMARALASYNFMTDTEAALDRMVENEIETMILHEVGQAMAGDLLGEQWPAMASAVARSKAEPSARYATCWPVLSTAEPTGAQQLCGLHFYFATFDARAVNEPAGLRAFLEHGDASLRRVARRRALAGDSALLAHYEKTRPAAAPSRRCSATPRA